MEDWTALAALLLDGIGDRVATAGHPTWFGVTAKPTSPDDFALRLVEDPPGFLGWDAPPDCVAVGLVGTGRAQVGDSPTEGRVHLAPGLIAGIRMCCLVTRCGDVVWRMMLPDGRSFEDAPQEGRLLDCLKRCFALPTPPPPVGTGHLLSVFWLGAIIDEVRRIDRGLTWREVSLLHPAARMATGSTPTGSGHPDVSVMIRVAASAWSWEALRVQAEKGSWAEDLVSPELAAWMDEGMFARWILGALPAPDELITRIRPRLPAATARRLAHAVRAAHTA
jgi:hypothetical protein